MEKFSLNGKRTMITGGSRGIGLGYAKAFAECGSHLVLVARTEDTLKKTKGELEPHGIAVNTYTIDMNLVEEIETFYSRVVEDTGGIELTWGNVEAIHTLIGQIASEEGLGRLLSGGVRRAAEKLGGSAHEFALEVKGLEPPAHDPRARFTVALGLATANRGACHLGAFTHDFEEGLVIDDLGSPGLPKRFTPVGKAENVFRMQNLMCMLFHLLLQ